MDDESTSLLGTQLPFPCPPRLPEGRDGMPPSRAGPARRRLRQVARLVVHRRGAASQARAAGKAPDPRAIAAGLPPSAAGEVKSLAPRSARSGERVAAKRPGEGLR